MFIYSTKWILFTRQTVFQCQTSDFVVRIGRIGLYQDKNKYGTLHLLKDILCSPCIIKLLIANVSQTEILSSQAYKSYAQLIANIWLQNELEHFRKIKTHFKRLTRLNGNLEVLVLRIF